MSSIMSQISIKSFFTHQPCMTGWSVCCQQNGIGRAVLLCNLSTCCCCAPMATCPNQMGFVDSTSDGGRSSMAKICTPSSVPAKHRTFSPCPLLHPHYPHTGFACPERPLQGRCFALRWPKAIPNKSGLSPHNTRKPSYK